jgi:hypothetical protein
MCLVEIDCEIRTESIATGQGLISVFLTRRLALEICVSRE